MDPQHALQTNRRAAIAALRVMWLDHCTQFSPRHDRIHGVEKLIAPRPFAVCLETSTLIGCHRQRLLLHPVLLSLSTPSYNARISSAVDLISIALNMNYFRASALAVIASMTLLSTGVIAPASAQTASAAQTTAAAPVVAPGGVSHAASMTKAEQRAARKVARKQARAKKNAELKKLEAAGYRPGGYNPDYPETVQGAERKTGAAAASQ